MITKEKAKELVNNYKTFREQQRKAFFKVWLTNVSLKIEEEAKRGISRIEFSRAYEDEFLYSFEEIAKELEPRGFELYPAKRKKDIGISWE